MPEPPSSVGFARGSGTLYVTAGPSLYRLATNARGNLIPFKGAAR